MKRIATTAFLFLALSFGCKAQIGFKSLSSAVTEPKSGYVEHKISLKIDPAPTADVVFNVVVTANGSADANDYIHDSGPLTFKKGGPTEQFFTLKVLSDTSSDEKPETVDLIISSVNLVGAATSNHHVVTINNFKEATEDNNYLASGGLSFDYLNGKQSLKPFLEIDVLLPDEWKITHSKNLGTEAAPNIKKRFDSYGIGFRFYQSRTISTYEDPIKRKKYENLNPFETGDSLSSVVMHQASDTILTTIDNLGLQARFFFRYSKNMSKNTRVYGVLNFEGLRQTTTRTATSASLLTDTLDNPEPVTYFDQYEEWTPKLKTVTNQINGYYGAGVFIHHSTAEVDLRVYSSGGIIIKSNLEHHIGAYMIFDFAILHKKSGVRLGGESRSVGGKIETRMSTEGAPTYSKYRNTNYYVYLAKTFSIDKIGELLKNSL